MIEEAIGSWGSYFKSWKKWHHPTANRAQGRKVSHWSLGGWWQQIKVKFFSANSDDPAWQRMLAIFAINGSRRHEENEVMEHVLAADYQADYAQYKNLLHAALKVSHIFIKDLDEKKYEESLEDLLAITLDRYEPQDVIGYKTALEKVLVIKRYKKLIESKAIDEATLFANLKVDLEDAKKIPKLESSIVESLESAKKIIKGKLQRQREAIATGLAEKVFQQYSVFQHEENSNGIRSYIKLRAEYEVLQEYHAALIPVVVFYDALSSDSDDLNSRIPFSEFKKAMKNRKDIPFKLYQIDEQFPGMPMPTDKNIVGAKMRNLLRWLDLVADLTIGNFARLWFWGVNLVSSGLSFLGNCCFNRRTAPQWLRNCVDTKLVRGFSWLCSSLIGPVIDFLVKLPAYLAMVSCTFFHFISKVDNFCCQNEPGLVRESVDAGLSVRATHYKHLRHLSSRRHSDVKRLPSGYISKVKSEAHLPQSGEQKLKSIVSDEKKMCAHKSTAGNVRRMLEKPRLIRSNSAAARLVHLPEKQVATVTVKRDEKLSSPTPKSTKRKFTYAVAAAPGDGMSRRAHPNGLMTMVEARRRPEIQMTTFIVPSPSHGLRG